MSANIPVNARTMPANPALQDTAALVGRILLAFLFIKSGFGKIGGFDGTVAAIASKGLPLPQIVAVLTILVELGGGILLAVGFKARWAALVIGIFTIAAGVLFHNYWAVEGAARMGQEINFWKNVAITGGMLMVFAFGPGRYSIDKG